MRLLFLIFALIIVQFGFSQMLDLTVSISNIEKIQGVLKIGLFNDESTFPHKGEEYLTLSIDVSKSSHSTIFRNLPEGEFAVSIFQDENTDGECNTNLLGFPKENYGFSNNYRPRFRAPLFKDCKIDLHNDTSIVIELH